MIGSMEDNTDDSARVVVCAVDAHTAVVVAAVVEVLLVQEID